MTNNKMEQPDFSLLEAAGLGIRPYIRERGCLDPFTHEKEYLISRLIPQGGTSLTLSYAAGRYMVHLWSGYEFMCSDIKFLSELIIAYCKNQCDVFAFLDCSSNLLQKIQSYLFSDIRAFAVEYDYSKIKIKKILSSKIFDIITINGWQYTIDQYGWVEMEVNNLSILFRLPNVESSEEIPFTIGILINPDTPKHRIKKTIKILEARFHGFFVE